eukprot:TRINITY_DN16978_c0_g1_i3.p1 TRINITY_DN16978_c0_g1~~TRINITY_DN16978_c0_g1_i3.p1  ORF type:complete len:205 (+),score=27.27 TRINITY_DN16978_c0_g1_i3:386-1000(+)
MKTFEGHVIHARAARNQELLLRHRVGVLEFRNPEGLACEDDIFTRLKNHGDSPLFCYHVKQGFRNAAGCAINVWFWNGTHETLAMQLGTKGVPAGEEWDRTWPPSVNYQGTYVTHRFVARLPSGRRVQEHQISKIPIPACPLLASSAKSGLNLTEQDAGHVGLQEAKFEFGSMLNETVRSGRVREATRLMAHKVSGLFGASVGS